jgi:hypothetical protein
MIFGELYSRKTVFMRKLNGLQRIGDSYIGSH